MEVSMVLRPWRNWQTRQLEVLVLETEWRFKSSWPHQITFPPIEFMGVFVPSPLTVLK